MTARDIIYPLGRAICATALCAAVAAGATACDDSEDNPSSLITRARILAIQATPPVVALNSDSTVDSAVDLRALVVAEDGSDTDGTLANALQDAGRWRVCSPWQPVYDPDLDCAPAASLALASDAETPHESSFSIADVLAAFPPPEWVDPETWGSGSQPPESGEESPSCAYDYIEVPVVFEVNTGDVRLQATKRVRVTLEPVGRSNPSIAGIVFDGQFNDRDEQSFVNGDNYTLTAAMAREQLDAACPTADSNNGGDGDGDTGGDGGQLEPIDIFAYVTAGTLDEPYFDIYYTIDGTESAQTISWKAPEDVAEAVLWLVAIDADGGTDWRRFALGQER